MMPPGREERLARLARDDFDVLVIGGGVSGAAVARDAVRRGFRTALIEAADFAWGTSSRSSRLVHGGLRYLEHFEFDLVFEASQERRTLLRIAPHLVRPLEFLFPIFREGRVGKRKLDAGMWLYDALSLFRNIERHQMLDTAELLRREPALRREGLLGGARYFDAQVDDARLVMMTALAALEDGAVVLNRTEVTAIDASDWPGHRVRVRDRETDREIEVDALAVVNATGPWAERLLGRAGIEAPESGVRIAPSRGSHVHVPRERIGHHGAFIFEAPQDGRVMFVLPWREELTLIGTTDVFHDGSPDAVSATPEEIEYLLEATNAIFPEARLGPDDVLSAWAGLRPLVAPPGQGDPGAVSREFDVREAPSGVFSLMGGKLTSHRRMAEETVDRVQAFLKRAGVPAKRKVDTAKVPLPGGGFSDLEALQRGIAERGSEHGISAPGAARLARAYGTRADLVIDLVQEEPSLAEPIAEGRPHILAEAVWAVRRELALHVDDILYRRTRLGYEIRDGIERAAGRVAELMGRELGWDAGRRREEVEEALAFRAADDAALAEARPATGPHGAVAVEGETTR